MEETKIEYSSEMIKDLDKIIDDALDSKGFPEDLNLENTSIVFLSALAERCKQRNLMAQSCCLRLSPTKKCQYLQFDGSKDQLKMIPKWLDGHKIEFLTDKNGAPMMVSKGLPSSQKAYLGDYIVLGMNFGDLYCCSAIKFHEEYTLLK